MGKVASCKLKIFNKVFRLRNIVQLSLWYISQIKITHDICHNFWLNFFYTICDIDFMIWMILKYCEVDFTPINNGGNYLFDFRCWNMTDTGSLLRSAFTATQDTGLLFQEQMLIDMHEFPQNFSFWKHRFVLLTSILAETNNSVQLVQLRHLLRNSTVC